MQCQGKCPQCGSVDMEYDCCSVSSGGNVYYPFRCTCGATGKEWYTVEYLESELDK